MNEHPTSHDSGATIFGATHAVRIGLALIAGLAVMCGLAAFDKDRRAQLESMTETTAVGDKAYVKLPAPPVVPTLRDQPLELVSGQRQRLHDTRMHRIGRDETAGLTIYEYLGAASKNAKAAPPIDKFYYLKTGVNEYVQARAPGTK